MSGGELRIRPFDAMDRDSILSVHEAAFRAAAIEFDPTAVVDEELRNVTETYADDDSTLLVGTVDEAVLVFGGYRPRGEGVAELSHLRVHPDHQRRGYAQALTAELEEQASQAGIDRFVLETHEDLSAARALYETLGYEETGRVAHEATGDEMIHYAKDL